VNQETNRPWFTAFVVESDDRPDSEAIWADGSTAVRISTKVRKPTRVERASILLIGAIAFGSIVVMVVSLVVAVYITRR
jgi:hypothetical protein